MKVFRHPNGKKTASTKSTDWIGDKQVNLTRLCLGPASLHANSFARGRQFHTAHLVASCLSDTDASHGSKLPVISRSVRNRSFLNLLQEGRRECSAQHHLLRS